MPFKSKKKERKKHAISEAQIERWKRKRAAKDHEYIGDKSTDKENTQESTPNLVAEDVVVETDKVPWNEGRRVVDLGVLAEGLSGCKKCGNPLQLSHCIGNTNYGLAGWLTIPCVNTKCGHINHVPTGKRHGRIFDVNTKLGAAIVHIGIGERQLNGLLTMLNIPVVSHSTLDARQRESGKTIETIANFSMQESIEEELRVVKEKTGKDDLVASVDAGWQKRGSGKSYDSLSGHCSMIGEETVKIIGYAVRSKQCKKCQQLVTSECESIKEHDCRKNFSGTAKSMEQDMVAEMITESRKKVLTSIPL